MAAREELGEARVRKITYINEMAAKRLAEYEAALAAGADNTEVSRQFATGTMPGDQQRALDASSSSLQAYFTTNEHGDGSQEAVLDAEETA